MRGLENFAISKFRLCEYPRFIEGLAIVKLGAAIANHAMGLLSDELFGAISQACREIMAGRFHEFFPVDMIQGGASCIGQNDDGSYEILVKGNFFANDEYGNLYGHYTFECVVTVNSNGNAYLDTTSITVRKA